MRARSPIGNDCNLAGQWTQQFMARQKADREDLFAEARNLRPRVELVSAPEILSFTAKPKASRTPEVNELFVVGKRTDGGLMVYCGMDFVVGFNRDGQLRRLHVDGAMYRADAGRKLARLLPSNNEGAIHVDVAHCKIGETNRLLQQSARHCRRIVEGHANGQLMVSRMAPVNAGESITDELIEALATIVGKDIQIAEGL